MTVWTNERVELLTKLWAEGMSSSNIRDEIGASSRNSVIGKAKRLGLAGRVQASSQPKNPRKPRPKPGPIALNGHVGYASTKTSSIVPSLPPERTEDKDIPMDQRCTIMDLGEGICRWPVGEPGTPEFFFCGGKTLEGLVYCGYHARIAYKPAA